MKLDGGLVRGIPGNSRNQEIISSIISLGRSLDFQVIAEYVESEEIRDTLKKLGCDLYQGYLYSPAVPLEHIKRMQFGRNISNSKGESPEEQTSYV